MRACQAAIALLGALGSAACDPLAAPLSRVEPGAGEAEGISLVQKSVPLKLRSQPSQGLGASRKATSGPWVPRSIKGFFRQLQKSEPLEIRSQPSQGSAAETYFLQAPSRPWVARSIKDIFAQTGTDKLWRHGYHRYYEEKLAPFRERPGVRVLEIGAFTGKSLGAWLTYFKHPEEVAGIAFRTNATQAHETACAQMPDKCHELKIFSLDQSNTTALDELKAEDPEGWDIIIDDGSHKPDHQIISFQSLWPKVRPGGFYAIEDVETSYMDHGRIYGYALHGGIGVPPPFNAVEKFKELADVVSRRHFFQEQFSVFGGVDRDVASVHFADGIIFVHKKPSDPDWNRYPTGLFFNKKHSEQSFGVHQKKLDAESSPRP